MDPLAIFKAVAREKDVSMVERPLPEEDEVAANLSRTQLTLERKMAVGTTTQLDRARQTRQRESEFLRYKPVAGAAGPSKVSERIIRVMECPVDPLEPPQFRHKRAPRQAPTEEPPAILHSPQKKLTAEDERNWNVPPAVSNWKNIHGYTIPLDKRMGADGRRLQVHQVNDKFAALSESLAAAENTAREEAQYRKELLLHQKRKHEADKEGRLRQQALDLRRSRLNRGGGNSRVEERKRGEYKQEDMAKRESRRDRRNN